MSTTLFTSDTLYSSFVQVLAVLQTNRPLKQAQKSVLENTTPYYLPISPLRGGGATFSAADLAAGGGAETTFELALLWYCENFDVVFTLTLVLPYGTTIRGAVGFSLFVNSFLLSRAWCRDDPYQ